MRFTMKPETERRLLRLALGELQQDEAERLRRSLASDPQLAATLERLRKTWSGLDLPTPAPAGRAFHADFWSRLHREGPGSPADLWRMAPAWNRALAAAALVAGIFVGVLAGGVGGSSLEESIYDEVQPSLAESYWTVVMGAPIEDAEGGER